MNADEKYILLAEDDPYVAELVLHVLQRGPNPPHVVHVKDGVDALDFLHARGMYAQRTHGPPAVVLLDVKMPRLDGLELLRELKADPLYRTLPVVMLTSSQDERDIATAYDLGANAYVVKPLEFPRLVEVLAALQRFWLEVNQPRPVTVPAAATP